MAWGAARSQSRAVEQKCQRAIAWRVPSRKIEMTNPAPRVNYNSMIIEISVTSAFHPLQTMSGLGLLSTHFGH